MADKFSEFGIDIGLSASGFDSVLAKFKHLSTEGEKIGKTTNEITKAMERLKTAMEHALNVDSAKKRLEQFTTKDGDRKRELAQEIANNTQRLLNIQNAWERAKKGFGDGGSVFGSLEKAIKTTTGGWVQLNTAIRPVKTMYRWVDAVAQLNMQLRMLHYSSGMAIASLKSYGAAASLYGGSANTVASYAQRHETQLARARRGLGLGHFQEAAWQFGFRFDANESPEARFRRAIAHIGTLRKEDRLAFAQLEAPGRVNELMGFGNRKGGLEAYDALQKYSQSLNELTDENGKIISLELSEKSEQLAESQTRLNEQWRSIREQFAYHLMPVVQSLTDKIVGIMEWFNELDPKKKRIAAELTGLVGAVVGAIGALGVFKLTFSKLWGLLKYVFPFLKNIGGGASGGVAGGAGGGFAGGAGGAAGGLAKSAGGALAAGIGSGVISAVGTAGMGYLVYTIANDVLMPWFAAWKAVNMLHSYDPKHKKEIVNSMKAGGIDEREASHLLLAGLQKIQFRKQQFADHKALYKRIGEIVDIAQRGESAQLARVTNNNISGDVKNDNRTFNIEQHFVSSGDVRKDAEDARDAMQERNMLDLSIN